MHVLGCQFDMAWEDKPANFARVRALLKDAHPPENALVVLPEMFATGFSMNVAAIAESALGETAAFLAQTAQEYGIYLLGGVVTAGADGKGRNEAVVFDPKGKEWACYCKMHPFTLGGEAKQFEAGKRPLLFACEGFTVAPFICYDLRFPEAFRSAVRLGAQVFVVIASWPTVRVAHWTALLRARAIENQAYVVGVNRCGQDPKLRHNGQSLIIDPKGEILAQAGEENEVIQAELDLSMLLAYRRDLPFLADIRPEYVPTDAG